MTYIPFPQPFSFDYLRMDRDHRPQDRLSTLCCRFRYVFHIAFHIFDLDIVLVFQDTNKAVRFSTGTITNTKNINHDSSL